MYRQPISEEEQAQLNAFTQEAYLHAGHMIQSGLMPTKGTDFHWITRCVDCKKIIGFALVSPQVASAITAYKR